MSTQDIEIKVPQLGESISEAMVGEWYVKEGAYVAVDARVVGLETDKATFDIPAQAGGVVTKILKHAGETATIGEVIGFCGGLKRQWPVRLPQSLRPGHLQSRLA